jgi:hypothetical protein
MGIGHCSKCGSRHIQGLACSHVVEAAFASAPRFEAEVLQYGDVDAPHLGLIYSAAFCRACIVCLALPPSGSFLSVDAVVRASEPVGGVCGGCLLRWLEKPQVAETAAPDGVAGRIPFERPAFSPLWQTDTVMALARQIDESQDFSAMPILADALQDAGCDSAEILDHCRGDGQHVRGCWVVDLVLGKE